MVDADLKGESTQLVNGAPLKETNGYGTSECNGTNGNSENGAACTKENEHNQSNKADEDKENFEGNESDDKEKVSPPVDQIEEDCYVSNNDQKSTESEDVSTSELEIAKDEILSDDMSNQVIPSEIVNEVENETNSVIEANKNENEKSVEANKNENEIPIEGNENENERTVEGNENENEGPSQVNFNDIPTVIVNGETKHETNTVMEAIEEENQRYESEGEGLEASEDGSEEYKEAKEINVDIVNDDNVKTEGTSGKITISSEEETSYSGSDEGQPLNKLLRSGKITPAKVLRETVNTGASGLGTVRLDTPYPFHRISARRPLRGGSTLNDSMTIQSAPTTPRVVYFPRLRRFGGEDALHLTSEGTKKRARDDEEEGPAAKRAKEGWWDWVKPLQWLRFDNVKTELAEEASPDTMNDSEAKDFLEVGTVCVSKPPEQSSRNCRIM